MEVITINGLEYVKAAVLAKRYNYATDYIGQLCRTRKVDAQLVGRTWYVNPLSLDDHKGAKKTKNQPQSNSRLNDKSFTYDVEINKSRLDVPPVLKRTTAKSIASFSPQKNFEQRISWTPARYESDEADLLPALISNREPVNLEVEPVESINVPIKKLSKSTNLVSEKLPTVYLQGKLKVEALEEDYATEAENLNETFDDITKEIRADFDKAGKSATARASVSADREVREVEPKQPKAATHRTAVSNATKAGNPTPRAPRIQDAGGREPATVVAIDFTPRRIKQTQTANPQGRPAGEILLVPSVTTKATSYLFRSLWLVFFILVVFGLLVFGLERVVESSLGQMESGWQWRVN